MAMFMHHLRTRTNYMFGSHSYKDLVDAFLN